VSCITNSFPCHGMYIFVDESTYLTQENSHLVFRSVFLFFIKRAFLQQVHWLCLVNLKMNLWVISNLSKTKLLFSSSPPSQRFLSNGPKNTSNISWAGWPIWDVLVGITSSVVGEELYKASLTKLDCFLFSRGESSIVPASAVAGTFHFGSHCLLDVSCSSLSL